MKNVAKKPLDFVTLAGLLLATLALLNACPQPDETGSGQT
jgi:hypothetical protein